MNKDEIVDELKLIKALLGNIDPYTDTNEQVKDILFHIEKEVLDLIDKVED